MIFAHFFFKCTFHYLPKADNWISFSRINNWMSFLRINKVLLYCIVLSHKSPKTVIYLAAVFSWCWNTHRLSVFRSFQPELPVTARPSRSRQKQNIDPGKLHRFTANVGIAPLTDHHGWNGEVFRVLWCKILDISFLVHITIDILIFISAVLQAKWHFLQKRQEIAVTWCILVTFTLLLNI